MSPAAKTQPTDADVNEFLASVTPAIRQADGFRLDALFQEVSGVAPVMWGPTIVGYGSMRTVTQAARPTVGVWPKLAFSPRKAQLSLYGLKDLPAGTALLPELGTYTEGAGCVYVRRLSDINEDVLRELARIAWQQPDHELN